MNDECEVIVSCFEYTNMIAIPINESLSSMVFLFLFQAITWNQSLAPIILSHRRCRRCWWRMSLQILEGMVNRKSYKCANPLVPFEDTAVWLMHVQWYCHQLVSLDLPDTSDQLHPPKRPLGWLSEQPRQIRRWVVVASVENGPNAADEPKVHHDHCNRFDTAVSEIKKFEISMREIKLRFISILTAVALSTMSRA